LPRNSFRRPAAPPFFAAQLQWPEVISPEFLHNSYCILKAAEGPAISPPPLGQASYATLQWYWPDVSRLPAGMAATLRRRLSLPSVADWPSVGCHFGNNFSQIMVRFVSATPFRQSWISPRYFPLNKYVVISIAWLFFAMAAADTTKTLGLLHDYRFAPFTNKAIITTLITSLATIPTIFLFFAS